MMHASNHPTSSGLRKLALVAMLLGATAVADERTDSDRMKADLRLVTDAAAGPQAGSGSGPASGPASGLVAGLGLDVPTGAIMAFMPNMTGGDYRNASELRAWIARQGWAICDGTGGTPDLRNQMLLGTTDVSSVGQRLGSWDHTHRIRGETGIPVRRNRNTPTGRLQNQQIPDDQHRHRVDMEANKAEHMPPSMRVLFIMKVR
jgi:hypothetical protein